MQAETLLSRAEVERITSLSTSVLYREMSAGRFKRPVRVSPGRVAWFRSDVDAYIAARVAERDAAPARRRARRTLLAAVT